MMVKLKKRLTEDFSHSGGEHHRTNKGEQWTNTMMMVMIMMIDDDDHDHDDHDDDHDVGDEYDYDLFLGAICPMTIKR